MCCAVGSKNKSLLFCTNIYTRKQCIAWAQPFRPAATHGGCVLHNAVVESFGALDCCGATGSVEQRRQGRHQPREGAGVTLEDRLYLHGQKPRVMRTVSGDELLTYRVHHPTPAAFAAVGSREQRASVFKSAARTTYLLVGARNTARDSKRDNSACGKVIVHIHVHIEWE